MLAAVSIGDPALFSGGDAILFYGGIIAAIGASVFGWWYANHRRKAKKGVGSSLACLLGLGMVALLTSQFLNAYGTGDDVRQVAPRVVDVGGTELTSATVGHMVFLWVAYVNDGEKNQNHTTILEVRDSKDVTVYLQFRAGTLEPNGTSESMISWVPKEHGSHVIRSFQITSFTEPLILSEIQAAEFNVSPEDILDQSKLPDMSMIINQPRNDGALTFHTKGVIGSYCWNNVCADTEFIVPDDLVNIEKGSTIEFQITNNKQPHTLGTLVYKTENMLAEKQLTAVEGGRYRVDLQSGSEYVLFVTAAWKDGENSAGDAVYYYRILVY